MVHLSKSLHVARNKPGYLIADIICSEKRTFFFESYLKENCELRGPDNDVLGQISEHIFALNGGKLCFHPSNICHNTRDILKIGRYHSEFTFGSLQTIEVVFLICERNRRNKYVAITVISWPLVAIDIVSLFCKSGRLQISSAVSDI